GFYSTNPKLSTGFFVTVATLARGQKPHQDRCGLAAPVAETLTIFRLSDVAAGGRLSSPRRAGRQPKKARPGDGAVGPSYARAGVNRFFKAGGLGCGHERARIRPGPGAAAGAAALRGQP
ncbi:hypothetical protein, partial [Caenispirillum bisanense]|uniref:hypothetical protein n=1 Tax=Caenispirillum bisanense TaxID=414052 RepID=UPI0031DC9EA0